MKNIFQITLILLLISCNANKTLESRVIGIGAGGSTVSPVVSSISPTSYGVKGGITATITGYNFETGATVIIGGSNCGNLVVVSATQITCTLPYHFASVVDVVVLNSSGISGTLFNGFSYNSFLFASNQSGSPALTRMKINSANGAITVLGTTATPNGSYGVEIDSTNTWVYTAGVTANQIAGFTIDHSNGNLTAVPGSPIAGGSGVNGLAVSKDSKCLIASNFNSGPATAVTSYTINQSTGALTKVADYTGGTNPGGIGIDPQNRFVYVANYGSSNISGYTLNTTTCTLAFINNYASGPSPDAISIHPNGKFVYTGNAAAGAGGAVTGLTINQTTGDLTLISTYTTSNANQGAGVEIDKTGAQLYVTARASGTAGAGKVWGFDINTSTGVLTSIGSSTTLDGPNDVRILGSGLFVFTANTESNSVNVFGRDLATGNLTPAAPASYTIGNSPGVIGITF